MPPERSDEFASAGAARVQAEEGEGREGLEGKEAREEARLQVAELLSWQGHVGDRTSDEGVPYGRAEYGPEAVSRRIAFARRCVMWGRAADLFVSSCMYCKGREAHVAKRTGGCRPLWTHPTVLRESCDAATRLQRLPNPMERRRETHTTL